MNRLLLVLLLFATSPSFAQVFNFEYDNSISVIKNGDTLADPWSGGLNFVQFSELDFDYDGDMDLIVFDRSKDNLRVFENVDANGTNEYVYRYNFRNLFPSDIRYRLFMADYNLDGKNDIFTYGIGGVKVYKNVGNSSLGLQWELVTDLLYSQYPFDYNNLYVSSSDIPAIHDIDNDGDLDILTFSLGGSHVEYHQNQSQDLYGHSDSLIFEVRNECWGKFGEDPNNSTLYLNDTAAKCTNSVISNPEMDKPVSPKAHAGSTLLALDFDNNGVKDLILGDISSPSLTKLVNGGSAVNTDSPMNFLEYNFPSNTTPANIQIFPAAFYLDVDFDGVKDLIVGANAKSASENVNSIRFYKNTGQDNLPTFIYQQDDFLQAEMIEHGTGSIPVFFDQNGDGKKDLVVANFFRYKTVLDKESTFALYQNTSGGGSTEFTYVDDNYLDINNLNLGLRTVPTFGDLDNDGDEDMIVARENGNLMYFENLSSGGNAVFASPIQPMLASNGTTINHGTFCFPQLFDLNDDGKLDLIIGRKNGTIVYYENTGSLSNPAFTLSNTQLGNVNVANISPDGFAAPHFFRHSDSTYLFCGAFDGKLHFYSGIDGMIAQDSSFVFRTNNFLNIDSKSYSSFWVNDIDNDNFLDLYYGHDLGGIVHLEVDPNSTSSLPEIELEKLQVYPNPASGQINIRNYSDEIKSVKLYNTLGQMVPINWFKSNGEISIDILSKTNGLFILQVELKTGEALKERIVVTK